MKGVCNDKKISRGEIYVADLNPYQGSEQSGIRPVVFYKMMQEIILVALL